MQPIIAVSIPAGLLMLGLSVLFPVLPFFIRSLGLSEIQAGVLFSVYAASSTLFSPFWGQFSQKHGRRPAIIIGLLGFALGFLLFGLGQSFGQLLAARLLGGILAAAALPAIFAYAADVTPAEHRSVGMGMIGAAIGLGIILGPMLGGMASHYNLLYPFYGTTAIGMGAALFVYFALPEPERRELGQRPSGFRRALLPFLIFAVLVSTARVGFETTIGFLLADRFAYGPRETGFLLGAIGVFGVAVQGGGLRTLAKLADDFTLMSLGTGLMALGLVVVGFCQSQGQLYAGGIVLAVGYALATPTFTALLSRAGEADQGTAQGLSQGAQSLGRVLGPLAFNTIYGYYGGVLTYVGAALLTMASLFWALAFFPPWRNQAL